MLLTQKTRKLIDLAHARQVDVTALLRHADLKPADLAHPGLSISTEQYEALLLQCLAVPALQDMAFALGRQTELGDMGIIGYALHSSRTMRDALGIWLEYSNSLTGSPLHLTLDEQAHGIWRLTVHCLSPRPSLQRYYIEEFLAAGVQLFRLLALQPPEASRLEFAYPPPAHVAVYGQGFTCPLVFDAPLTVFSFRTPGLDTPIHTNNEELHQIIAEHCRTILHHLRYSTGVESRVRNLLLVNARELPDIATTSSQLGVSQRTLRRRLEQNGHSYRQIKHDFRHDLALQYLASPYISVKEISHMLGYTSPSAFCRAFKHWTGCSPGDYRRRVTAPDTPVPTTPLNPGDAAGR